jgi:hypothetical protein
VTNSRANGSGVGDGEASPNVNCLDGKRCPKCGSHGPFEIVVAMRVLLFDDGTDYAKDGTVEYDDEAPAVCDACQYKGKFRDFDAR